MHSSISTPPPAAAAEATDPARHRTALWRYLRALGAGPGEVDDLVQDALLVGCRTALAGEDLIARLRECLAALQPRARQALRLCIERRQQ